MMAVRNPHAFRRLMAEPMLHFAVFGAVLFIALGSSGDPVEVDRTVVVSRGQVARLVTLHRMTTGAPPTPAELEQLVDDFVREEVLFREAVRLGLHRDDEIVRRRLAQKLDALMGDASGEAAYRDLRRRYEVVRDDP